MQCCLAFRDRATAGLRIPKEMRGGAHENIHQHFLCEKNVPAASGAAPCQRHLTCLMLAAKDTPLRNDEKLKDATKN